MFINNDLVHCSNDLTGFLVEPFIVPARIDLFQLPGNPVVFSHPNGMHNGESDQLIRTVVPSYEEWKHAVVRGVVLKGKISFQCVQATSLFQESTFEKPKFVCKFSI